MMADLALQLSLVNECEQKLVCVTSEQKLEASAHDLPCSLFPTYVLVGGHSISLGPEVKMTQIRATTELHWTYSIREK